MKLFALLCLFVAASVAVATRHRLRSPGKICEPGSFFMDDCNKCWCSNDGLHKTCTRINCLESSDEDGDEGCTPGEEFGKACNRCVCTESGLKKDASCSEEPCPEDFSPHPARGPSERFR